MESGSCQCGAVEYSFIGDPLTCYACHCTDCQSGSGSAFSLSMIVRRENIDVVSGEVVEDNFFLNGNDLIRSRCSKCSSGLWYGSPVMPEIVALKPGTFKNTNWFSPVAHVWTRSAQPWVTFDPAVKTFEKQPEINELIALWQQQ